MTWPPKFGFGIFLSFFFPLFRTVRLRRAAAAACVLPLTWLRLSPACCTAWLFPAAACPVNTSSAARAPAPARPIAVRASPCASPRRRCPRRRCRRFPPPRPRRFRSRFSTPSPCRRPGRRGRSRCCACWPPSTPPSAWWSSSLRFRSSPRRSARPTPTTCCAPPRRSRCVPRPGHVLAEEEGDGIAARVCQRDTGSPSEIRIR